MQRLKRPQFLSDNEAAVSDRPAHELTIRIYSAVLLIAVSLLMTVTSLTSFGILIGVFALATAWEWCRLVRGTRFDTALAVHAATLAAASWVTVGGCFSCAIFAVIAGTIAVFLVRSIKEQRAQAWWSAAGVYYIGFPTVSLIWLRSDPDYGVLAILFLFAIVWTTDSAAFFVGRWIGGPKLAPRISPKKTWAGLVGGTGAAAVMAAIFSVAAGIFSPWLVGLAIILALVTQCGDLGESAIKRVFGQKDTSALIPGHGGVLDRLDGLLFAATAAALIALAHDPSNPGRALLLWP